MRVSFGEGGGWSKIKEGRLVRLVGADNFKLQTMPEQSASHRVEGKHCPPQKKSTLLLLIAAADCSASAPTATVPRWDLRVETAFDGGRIRPVGGSARHHCDPSSLLSILAAQRAT